MLPELPLIARRCSMLPGWCSTSDWLMPWNWNPRIQSRGKLKLNQSIFVQVAKYKPFSLNFYSVDVFITCVKKGKNTWQLVQHWYYDFKAIICSVFRNIMEFMPNGNWLFWDVAHKGLRFDKGLEFCFLTQQVSPRKTDLYSLLPCT